MGRLHKVLNVEGPDGEPLAVTVHELTVKQIISIATDGTAEVDRSTSGLLQFMEQNLPKCTTLTVEQAQGMAPSELKKVYEAFKEVNAVFFELAREVGLLNLLTELKAALVVDFSNLLVGSLKRATAPLSLTTDTASSLTP